VDGIVYCSRDYWLMNAAWRAIVAMPLSPEEKQLLCLDILRTYIGRMALRSVQTSNPALRFFLAMLRLRDDLFPAFASDDYGKLVIMPLHRLVWAWIDGNWQSAAPATSIGHAAPFLAQQLR
jgi:hypothetical protein